MQEVNKNELNADQYPSWDDLHPDARRVLVDGDIKSRPAFIYNLPEYYILGAGPIFDQPEEGWLTLFMVNPRMKILHEMSVNLQTREVKHKHHYPEPEPVQPSLFDRVWAFFSRSSAQAA